MIKIRLLFIVMMPVMVVISAGGLASAASGFDLSRHSIPIDEIESGGPAKDAIPALTSPVFVGADQAFFLDNNDIVLGVEIDGRAKAYPVKILNWHEAVNDRLAGRNILATW
jgi:hypothetical protein